MTRPYDGSAVNSAGYWDGRFLSDWEDRGGPQQTQFFARLALRMLPDWLREDLACEGRSILDFGCAEGDAVPVLAAAFPGADVRGSDFSLAAIEIAAGRYPNHGFSHAPDGRVPHEADVIFCSNTIEHLPHWRDKLSELARHARRHVIALAPFDEFPLLEPEHVASFGFGTLPAALDGGLKLVHHAIVSTTELEGSRWVGRQFLAVWSRPGAFAVHAGEAAADTIGDFDTIDFRDVPAEAIPHCLRLAKGDYRKFDRLRAERNSGMRRLGAAVETLGMGEANRDCDFDSLVQVATERLLHNESALKLALEQLTTFHTPVASELTAAREEARAAREELATLTAALEHHNAAVAEHEAALQSNFDMLRNSYSTVTSMNSFRYMMRALEQYGRIRGVRIAVPPVPEQMRVNLERLDLTEIANLKARSQPVPRMVEASNANEPSGATGAVDDRRA
jgi:SAM-dependent methyltransferase